MTLKDNILDGTTPRHVAIIMDGNGRWARQRGLNRIMGHRNGVQAVRDALEAAMEQGVEYLTLYAFSTENWNRPKEEVTALMSLLVQTIRKETDSLMQNGIRLLAIGDIPALPTEACLALQELISRTAANSRVTLVLALNYSGKWDLLQAARRMAAEVEAGRLSASDVDEACLAGHLSTAGIPDPELLIRTSGECRLSNFLLWQTAYTELYFTPVLWPDFRKADFLKALDEFRHRERRFGMTSEQINSTTK